MSRLSFYLAVVLACRAAVAQNSAPSSHLVFDDDFVGDIVINEVRVPKDGEALYTYYEALGWRGKGAGYAGIQAHPKAHLGARRTVHRDRIARVLAHQMAFEADGAPLQAHAV